MDHYADDLAALTEHLNLKNTVHIGHSTGGGEVKGRINMSQLARPGATHIWRAVPLVFLSSHPNSTCPRMREPDATVIEVALTSPTMTPVVSKSTCLAALMSILGIYVQNSSI